MVKMMADLISRAAAIAEIEEYIEEYSELEPETGYHNLKWCAMEEAKDVLSKLPAVDAVPVVRCAYCKHCFDMGSDPMEPYDGESEWYCERFDRDTSAYNIDPYRFFCADGERRDSE
jgi:hypothetical protein